MATVRDISTDDFLEQLAAEQPTPGGGSAAAMAGAAGAALISMACRYTVGRDRYRDAEPEATAVLERSEALRSELQALAQDDVDAYGAYAAAQKLPRETDAERAERDAALEAALRRSTEVPLAVVERTAELIELGQRAARVGNPWLISDAAVGAQLALAGCDAAALNVELNVGGLDDAEFARACRERLDAARGDDRLRASVDATVAVVHERRG
jgi:formiminotetrahydrofolate cyclodeaminase